MAARAWSRLRRSSLCNRRVGITLLWVLATAVIAVGVNVAGIHVVGSVDGWARWLREHSAHFLVWRLLLYAATTHGWLWMRRRLRAREPSAVAHQRLLRVEIAAIATLALLEGSQLLRMGLRMG